MYRSRPGLELDARNDGGIEFLPPCSETLLEDTECSLKLPFRESDVWVLELATGVVADDGAGSEGTKVPGPP